MKLENLVRHLTADNRLGMNEALASKLGLGSAEATRGKLLAQADEDRSHLGVYLLGLYVVDDDELLGEGEIYWWSVPALVDREGKARREPLAGLPTGAMPHKCGSREWLTNVSLADPPLLAVIPPAQAVKSCQLHVAICEDDGDIADVGTALGAGLTAYAALGEQLPGAEALISPVRAAVWEALGADDDDLLMDQTIPIRRGEHVLFGRGIVDANINAMVRLYYFVRDEAHTLQAGPFSLARGEAQRICFERPMEQGGRVALFARGADVKCPALGDLSEDVPFRNRVLHYSQAKALADGFEVQSTGSAELIAFYTPHAR